MYHPDLNRQLLHEAKEANSTRYVGIIAAYDVLKDKRKKQQYDLSLDMQNGAGSSLSFSSARSDNQWQNKYYGEAKYYSKSGSQYTASGLNTSSHRAQNFGGPTGAADPTSTFSGQHINYGDRNGVPHFDYNEKLLQNLKFEQHMISKSISEVDRKQILEQLLRSGEKVDEELVTKHLLRHVNQQNAKQASTAGPLHSMGAEYALYMYQGPRQGYGNAESELLFGVVKAFLVLCGAGSSIFAIYNLML